MPSMEPGKERGSARRANARSAVGLQVPCALRCHLIDSRRLDQWLSIASQVALGDVVTEHEDQVRFSLHRSGAGWRLTARLANRQRQAEGNAGGGKERRQEQSSWYGLTGFSVTVFSVTGFLESLGRRAEGQWMESRYSKQKDRGDAGWGRRNLWRSVLDGRICAARRLLCYSTHLLAHRRITMRRSPAS